MGFGSFLGAINPVAAIGSALSLGGDVLAYKGAKDTNENNLQIAREQMAFQERMANSAQDFSQASADTAMNWQQLANRRAMDYQTEMSNTAYQRGMRDMKKAGLNPILAYSQGGASTPIGFSGSGIPASGVSAHGAGATMMNPAGVFSGTGGRIMDAVSTAADTKLKSQQTDTAYWQGRQAATQAGVNQVTADKIAEEIDRIGAEKDLIDEQGRAVKLDNTQRQIMADFYESSEFAAIAQKFGVRPDTLANIFRAVFPGGKRK